MKKLTVFAICMMLFLSGCGKTESEARPAMSLNGEEISLREWNFYVRMNQMIWEKDELETYGEEMWSTEVSEDGRTMADHLKEQVLDTIMQTHLMNQHAEEYGTELTEEDRTKIAEQAESFLGTYHDSLLTFAGADRPFVEEKLAETRMAEKVAQAMAADYEPELEEASYHQEGICYVLVSTTGMRNEDGTLMPFTEEEVSLRTETARRVARKAQENGDLKGTAEAEGLTPIESSMGNTNVYDGKEPRMLNAARKLKVGEVSDPIETEEGWFVVQHTNADDSDGTAYWKEYLTEQAKEDYCTAIYEGWKQDAEIILYEDVMDTVIVNDVLKELL